MVGALITTNLTVLAASMLTDRAFVGPHQKCLATYLGFSQKSLMILQWNAVKNRLLVFMEILVLRVFNIKEKLAQ
jgi:hypothetical protein